MKDFCHFLDAGQPGGNKRCTAGINFSSVGPERALCRLCPLADLGPALLCPNVEVYTYLRNPPSGMTIEAEFRCLAEADMPLPARCDQCPDRGRAGIPVQPGLRSFIR